MNQVAAQSLPLTTHFHFAELFKKRWVYHSFFWVFYYLFYSLLIIFGVYHVRDLTFYFQLILFFVIDMALVYFNFYVLIPRLLSTRRYLYYGISLLLAFVIISFLNILLKQFYAKIGPTLFALTSEINFANVTVTTTFNFSKQ